MSIARRRPNKRASLLVANVFAVPVEKYICARASSTLAAQLLTTAAAVYTTSSIYSQLYEFLRF